MRTQLMKARLSCLALLSLGLVGGVPTPGVAQASDPPFQSRPFATDGIVSHVDINRDRLIINSDEGQACLLDTSEADITLLGGSRSGMTLDLAPGMRVHVSGQRLSSGLVEVTQLRVLKPGDPSAARPRGPVVPQAPTAAAAGEDIQLRGTVDTLDTWRGVFVVRVRDHTRTIYLADDTDLSGMALRDTGRFPVKPGDRVTVWGRLQPDGGVLAGAVSRAITPPAALPHPDRILFGKITSTSNRFTGRDIKIRLADDREVKVKVRRGLTIRRDGQEISVHDLRGGDDVRATGSFDGSDFKADYIDVLHRDEDPDAPAPTRGL